MQVTVRAAQRRAHDGEVVRPGTREVDRATDPRLDDVGDGGLQAVERQHPHGRQPHPQESRGQQSARQDTTIGQRRPDEGDLGTPRVDQRLLQPLPDGRITGTLRRRRQHRTTGDLGVRDIEYGVAEAAPLVVHELHALAVDEDVLRAHIRGAERPVLTFGEQVAGVGEHPRHPRRHRHVECAQRPVEQGEGTYGLITQDVDVLGAVGAAPEQGPEVALPTEGGGVHAPECLAPCAHRVDGLGDVTTGQQPGHRPAVAEVAEHENTGLGIGCDDLWPRSRLRRQRRRVFVGRDLAMEGVWFLIDRQCLDDQRPRLGERVLGDAHPDDRGAAAAPEILGIFEYDRRTCALRQHGLGCAHDADDATLCKYRHGTDQPTQYQ